MLKLKGCSGTDATTFWTSRLRCSFRGDTEIGTRGTEPAFSTSLESGPWEQGWSYSDCIETVTSFRWRSASAHWKPKTEHWSQARFVTSPSAKGRRKRSGKVNSIFATGSKRFRRLPGPGGQTGLPIL